MSIIRPMLYQNSSTIVACYSKDKAKEYLNFIMDLIKDYNLSIIEDVSEDDMEIKFKNGSKIIVDYPADKEDVIRSKRAEISHWLYDDLAFSIGKEEFEKIVEPYINKK